MVGEFHLKIKTIRMENSLFIEMPNFIMREVEMKEVKLEKYVFRSLNKFKNCFPFILFLRIMCESNTL